MLTLYILISLVLLFICYPIIGIGNLIWWWINRRKKP